MVGDSTSKPEPSGVPECATETELSHLQRLGSVRKYFCGLLVTVVNQRSCFSIIIQRVSECPEHSLSAPPIHLIQHPSIISVDIPLRLVVLIREAHAREYRRPPRVIGKVPSNSHASVRTTSESSCPEVSSVSFERHLKTRHVNTYLRRHSPTTGNHHCSQ